MKKSLLCIGLAISMILAGCGSKGKVEKEEPTSSSMASKVTKVDASEVKKDKTYEQPEILVDEENLDKGFFVESEPEPSDNKDSVDGSDELLYECSMTRVGIDRRMELIGWDYDGYKTFSASDVIESELFDTDYFSFIQIEDFGVNDVKQGLLFKCFPNEETQLYDRLLELRTIKLLDKKLTLLSKVSDYDWTGYTCSYTSRDTNNHKDDYISSLSDELPVWVYDGYKSYTAEEALPDNWRLVNLCFMLRRDGVQHADIKVYILGLKSPECSTFGDLIITGISIDIARKYLNPEKGDFLLGNIDLSLTSEEVIADTKEYLSSFSFNMPYSEFEMPYHPTRFDTISYGFNSVIEAAIGIDDRDKNYGTATASTAVSLKALTYNSDGTIEFKSLR